MNEQQARRNIRLLKWSSGFRGAMVLMPVVVPFFQSNGLSQTEIFVLQAVFSIVTVVFEVPSGYFADRFGRRLSILAGAILTIVGFGVYALAYGFWPMAVAEAILGIGLSLVSGADVALAIDTIKKYPHIDTAGKFLARSFRYALIGEMLASLLGGVIATYSLRATVAAQVLVFLPLIPLALALHEPEGHKRLTKKNALRDAWEITKYALHGHREIKWLIFYSALVSTITYPMVWLTQPYYQMLGIPIGWFGVLWAVQYALTACFTGLVGKYEKLGRKAVLVSFTVIGVVCYLVLGLWPSFAALAALAGFWFIRAMAKPTLGDYINQLVESDVRATVLSAGNLVSRLFAVTVTVGFLGQLTDNVSLSAAMLASAAIFGAIGAVILSGMNRAKLLG